MTVFTRSSVWNSEPTDHPTDDEETLHLAELIEVARERGLIQRVRFLPTEIEIEMEDGGVTRLAPDAIETYLRCLIARQ